MTNSYRIIGYKKVSFTGKNDKLIDGYRFYFARYNYTKSDDWNGFVDIFDKFVFSNREELISNLLTYYTSYSNVYLLYNERGHFIDVKESKSD